MGKPSDLVQGTLDLLILKTISLEPQHGWAIAKCIQQISNEVLQVQQGSLYPALHRLEQQGWIRAKWAETDSGRQAKFIRLPPPAELSWNGKKKAGAGCRARSTWWLREPKKEEAPMRWLERFRMAMLMLFRGRLKLPGLTTNSRSTWSSR